MQPDFYKYASTYIDEACRSSISEICQKLSVRIVHL